MTDAPVDEFEFYRQQAFGSPADPNRTPLSRRPRSFRVRRPNNIVDEDKAGARSQPHSPSRDVSPRNPRPDYLGQGEKMAVGRSKSVKVQRETRNMLAVPSGTDLPLDEAEEQRKMDAYRVAPRHNSFSHCVDKRCQSGSRPGSKTGSRNRLDVLTPDVVPVRSFATTPHGIVNKGDSIKSSSSSINGSMHALDDPALSGRRGSFKTSSRRGSYRVPTSPTHSGDRECEVATAQLVVQVEHQPDVYYVQVLGAAGVGKSSLCQQFLTSEYMGDIDPDEVHQHTSETACQMRVSVKLDGEESVLVLLDSPPHVEDEEMEVLADMDAYVIIYGVDDRGSFAFAHTLLTELLEKRNLKTAVLLVGNKSDLVRTREIETEHGKLMSKKFDCKFTETSSTLNHGIDELLVDLLKDIRTRQNPAKVKEKEHGSKISRLFKKLSVRVRKPKRKEKNDD